MDDNDSDVTSSDVSIQRLGRNGYLHRVIPIFDQSGKIVQRIVKPLMVEFRLRDALQTIVGASILAIPAAYTEEAWNLGRDLPAANITAIALISILFIGTFVYFNFYKGYIAEFRAQFVIRVLTTYLLSAFVVAILLTVIEQAPWGVDNALALKRIVVVAFPAAMSATVTDALK
ncbi:MAG: DUF2391 family protein [Woeseiaceae bacterium]